MELSIQEFLDSVSNKRTRKGYKLGIKKFCEWFGKSAEEILKLRQEDLTQRSGEGLVEFKNRATRLEKEIEKFHSYLLEKYSINTARSLVVGVCQLFRFYEMPVRIRKGSRVSQTVKSTSNFPLTIEHIRAMYEFADLRERVILSMATDLGLRIGDFLQLKKNDIPDLSQEPPISFELMTNKEKIVAHGFISQESVGLLKLHLPTLEKKNDNPYLFPSNGKSHISDEWLNRLLQNLSEKAQIDLKDKKLTFHCFRKMFLSASIDSGIGLTAGKKLCGKAIAKSDDTYLTTVHLRGKFIQLKKYLTIVSTEKPEDREKMKALENAVMKLQEELTQQRVITNTVTKGFSELKSMVVDMGQQLKEAERATTLLEKAEKMGFMGIEKKE